MLLKFQKDIQNIKDFTAKSRAALETQMEGRRGGLRDYG